jgi:hypothetical protein
MFNWFNKEKSYSDASYAADQRYYNKLEKKMTETDEPYRVGVTLDGKVTLTLIAGVGNSMTLTMSPEACEAMIRVLRATYTTEKAAENV